MEFLPKQSSLHILQERAVDGDIGYIRYGKEVTMAKVPDFLLHHDGDSVAVANDDLQPGTLEGLSVKEQTKHTAVLNHAIPLGHKFALKDHAEGEAIIKYGIKVGIASQPIKKGDYVHTHNMRSYRWEASRA
ncbi:MAG: hypothetical protein RLZZ19_109 [Actinomycetota bacterium]|mgnify:CR=1 FL=1